MAGDSSHHPPVPVPPATPDLVGLALSGGGIRSATFALGVLQALDRLALLRIFDYLSTVSGGGFSGGWWSAWLARGEREAIFPRPEDIEPTRHPPRLLREGEGASTGSGVELAIGVPDGGPLGPPSPDPVHYLRLFSNYLTPRRGLLSADTWRAVAFYVRSLLFNWLVLLPLFLAVVVAGQLYFVGWDGDVGREFVCSAPDRMGPAPADRVVVAAPTSPLCDGFATPHGEALQRRLRLAALPFVALLTAMAVVSLLWLLHGSATPWVTLLAFAVEASFLVYLASALLGGASGGGPIALIAAVAAGVVVAAHLIDLARIEVIGDAIQHDVFRTHLSQWHTLVLAATVALALWLAVAGFGHEIAWFLFYPGSGAAMAGVRRAGGWAGVLGAIASAAWTAYAAAPSSRAKDSAEPAGPLTRAALAVVPYVVLAVLACGLATAGRSVIANLGMPGALPALVAGLLAAALVLMLFALWDRGIDADWLWRAIATPVVGAALASVVVPHVVRPWSDAYRSWVVIVVCAALAPLLFSNASRDAIRRILTLAIPGLAALFTALDLAHLSGFDAAHVLRDVALAAILLLIALVVSVGWTSDPNVLSMHTFYKARLVRAYLGASNPERWGNAVPVTGPAVGDDVRLSGLWNFAEGAPYHLVNTTLNLVASRDLATAQRLSADFVLSKFYCGSARTGYRLTTEYMGGELTLGTAVAISGAAASPNMGARTPSMPLVLILALLNARLGFWAPSPGRDRWREARATMWPYYLLRETLSQTTDLSTYCYLSDGGHFDNTGLYALVERGCRYIVVVDCGADPAPCFEDVGDAIRRCRIDFGAEFSFDVEKLLARSGAAAFSAMSDDQIVLYLRRALARRQVLAGRIQYRRDHWEQLGLGSVSDDERLGVILWIKPAVVRANAVDVRQYNLQNPVFPQQTTMDQWFDEAQFESYRKLGYDSTLGAMTRAAAAVPRPPGQLQSRQIRAFFDRLWARYR